MALNTRDLLKPQTVLQQLLEEINFQRAKEMRHLLKDDGGFVVLQGTTYWTDLFVRHFLFQSANESIIDSDDLLFFVRKKHVRGSSRNMPKYDIDVDVFRKDSKKLPIGDPDVDWEETVYLNLVIHQFDYKLTLAICTRTSPKELQVLRRHTQRVYASPSRRKMDTKGESEEMTFPHICFMVDNFDEVFSDIMVRDGEMVCVELVASDKDGSVQGVIFLGSIRYDALKKVYDARQSSLGSKVAQRMTFGLFAGGQQTRCEFVRMKGPQGKGHAEMAVTKPKGSGVETPTSEPGFSATEMWDEWDEDPDDFFNYKHQRRLSDPCSNINNFSRFAFRSRGGGMNDTAQSKARSENEGLDALGNEISEIEAGDLRDDCPASSTPSKTVKDSSTTCCCFNKTRHSSIYGSDEMSDMYSRPIDDMSSPACLADVPLSYCKQKSMNLLNVESEIELSHTKDIAAKKTKTDLKSHETVLNNNKKIDDDFEVGDDAIDALTDSNIIEFNSDRVRYRNDPTDGLLVRVRGKEELPAKESLNAVNLPKEIDLNTNTVTTVKSPTSITDKNENQCKFIKNKSDLLNGNKTVKLTRLQRRRWQYCTLPRKAKPSFQCHRGPIELGHRRTPDGTDIYYWCDLPKKIFKELDDGAYNPLWATRGFTQTFHFWKENKRQQSTPLNAFLTYVTLPWWSIAKDLLDNREMPILTF